MANTYKVKNITVRQKIATGDDTYIVCGNSDYTVHWDLDDEWAEYNEKTMLVRVDNSPNPYTVQFTGTDAELPALYNTRRCVIGLMAGDVRTTTGAMFVCLPSARDASGVPVEPPEDVYAQLVSQLARKISEPSQDGTAGQALVTDGKGGRSWGDVARSGSELPEVSYADCYSVLGVEYDTENAGYRWGVTPAASIVKVVEGDNNLLTLSDYDIGTLIAEAQYKTTILLYGGYYYYCSSEPSTSTYYTAFRRITVNNATKLQFSYFEVSPRYSNVRYYDWADVTPAGVDGITPTIDNNGNWYLGDTDTGKPSRGATGAKGDPGPQGPAGKDGAGMDITGASVGQIAKIAAVDASGKPTAWSPVDIPSAGSETWELIRDFTLTEDVAQVTINLDENGKPFRLKKAYVFITATAPTDESITYSADICFSPDKVSPSVWGPHRVYVGTSPAFGKPTRYAMSLWDTYVGIFLPVEIKSSYGDTTADRLVTKTSYDDAGAILTNNNGLEFLQSPCESFTFGSYRKTLFTGANIKIYGVRA